MAAAIDLAAPEITGLLARCHYPRSGTPVVCAVSGGADSLALLVLARAAGCPALAVHVDHGLRPGSAGEADVVAAVAAAVGADFRAERVDVAAGPNLEARARAARYGVLPDGALTGHTADDRAETMLINGLLGGLTYLNVHSTAFPGGEIRGFVVQIPEPEVYALLLAGLAVIGVSMRKRRRA